MKKQIGFKTKGMNRDLSVSAFNPEFAFENRNLRLSTNESNTLLSWVNEKGTLEIPSSRIKIDLKPWIPAIQHEYTDYSNTIIGTPIGTAVINHQLVLFTHEEIPAVAPSTEPTYNDRIFVLNYNKDASVNEKIITGSCLFKGNLNFRVDHPIECLVSYEAEDIQKVYWVDGLNQPRIINIKANDDKVEVWNTSTGLATFFDFNPSIALYGNISVERNNTTGTFAPGVIQYAFCYLNMYSQQSNIVDISPLYYISPADRGASPEERVTCCFEITISATQVDTSYNYIRLFSIQRTSIDGTPIVKHLIDISLSEASGGNNIYYKDTGVNGEVMDSTALLFMSKRPISAETIADKDNTLFLGNITDLTEPTDDIQAYFDEIRGRQGAPQVTFDNSEYQSSNKVIQLEDSTGTIYKNTFELENSQQKISTFKGGEEYRFGFQLKDKYGVWTNPIFIDDFTNDCYPSLNKSFNDYSYHLVHAEAAINIDDINQAIHKDIREKYTEIRPVIVHPTEADRKVLCQGVLNPTVFQASSRKNANGLDSQSSWLFRPMSNISYQTDVHGNFATFKHYESLPWHTVETIDVTDVAVMPPIPAPYQNDWGADVTLDLVDDEDLKVEIFGAAKLYENTYDISSTPDLARVNTQFFIDQSIVTLNSPDIELGENFTSELPDDVKLRIVGAVPITSNVSYTYVESSNKETAISMEQTPDYTLNNISEYGGQRLISDFLWQDSLIINASYKETMNGLDYDWSPDERVAYNGGGWPNHRVNKFFVNYWHATRPLNNDWEQNRTMLKKKVIVTQLFSNFSQYFYSGNNIKQYENISAKLYNSINKNIAVLPKQGQDVSSRQKTYGGYVDTALLNSNAMKPLLDFYMPSKNAEVSDIGMSDFDDHVTPQRVTREENVLGYVASQQWSMGGAMENNIVSMKYNSANHAVIAFNESEDPNNPGIPILPYLELGSQGRINYYVHTGAPNNYTTFWNEEAQFQQEAIDYSTVTSPLFSNYAFLWIGELYRDTTTEFGGKTLSAIKANNWLIGGEAQPIDSNTSSVTLYWTNGDTFFQRYDCLKTYPITSEDVNQNSEILSFMCETRVNLDGRYDKLRGVSKSILPLIDSTNINKINPVYSQKDNYFTSKVFQQEDIISHRYPNYICYSMTKEPGSDVDTYTDISLASVLALDGDKGEISALRKLNNHLFAFQDSGISRVMFNDNVQVQSTEGVPIQIANSGKVLGKDYISNTVGCSNKWSIVQTPNGLYFMDSNDKSIYLFNGQLENISAKNGFNTWCKQHIPSQNKKWFPANYTTIVGGQEVIEEGFQNFRGFYDKQNQEVLYVNKEEALAWSEKLGAFTSFYDYGESPFFENLDDVGLWLKSNGSLWRHQAGDYCKFFGTKQPYSMTLVGNPEPQMDKIFTNLEFRAIVEREGELDNETGKFTPTLPFSSLEVWDEYQHGFTTLSERNGYDAFTHHTSDMDSSLKRKFRIWRCDIPRNNCLLDDDPNRGTTLYSRDNELGIYRYIRKPLDRMRNPWIYLKLKQDDINVLGKTEIHDVVMTYFD